MLSYGCNWPSGFRSFGDIWHNRVEIIAVQISVGPDLTLAEPASEFRHAGARIAVDSIDASCSV